MDEFRRPRRPQPKKVYLDDMLRQRREITSVPNLRLKHSAQPVAKPVAPILHAPKETANTKTRKSLSSVVVLVLAAAVFAIGIFASVQTLQTNQNSKKQVAALARGSGEEGSGDVPSETKPKSSVYKVAPLLPKYIKISKLGVNARVKALGVTSSNQLQAPSNIYDAGWYNASAHPGDSGSNGAVLIDGHVHGPTLPGVFANLAKLASGDSIQIIRGDDKVIIYKVIKVQSFNVKNVDMSMLLASVQPGMPGLNLITCSGKYDKNTASYTQRTAVFAIQTSPAV